MKLRRVEPGVYQSHDGRVRIKRDEFVTFMACWRTTLDGESIGQFHTKHAAVRAAEAELKRKEGVSDA